MKKNLALAAAALFAISACASNPVETSAQSSNQEGKSGNEQVLGTAQGTSVTTSGTATASLTGQLQAIQSQSIYFDFGQAAIKPEGREIIQKLGEFMSANPGVTVKLEGNTDERGSNEFNLALGDKRANAVRSSLKVMGVADSRIQAVSYGEERPRSTCHDESCWHENRRVDIVGTVAP